MLKDLAQVKILIIKAAYKLIMEHKEQVQLRWPVLKVNGIMSSIISCNLFTYKIAKKYHQEIYHI